MLSVASREGAGTAATSSGSLCIGGGTTSFALGAASVLFALAVCTGAPALGAVTGSLALGGVFESLACGAFGSCACEGADSGASTLADPTLGAGGATDATVLASPSESRWLRAMTPVPTISVNASGAATSNLPLIASVSGQVLGRSFRNLGMRRLGRRRVGLGAGTGTVRLRLLGAELIA
jgi:hypothetical protein